jgi:hypothetical protein
MQLYSNMLNLPTLRNIRGQSYFREKLLDLYAKGSFSRQEFEKPVGKLNKPRRFSRFPAGFVHKPVGFSGFPARFI